MRDGVYESIMGWHLPGNDGVELANDGLLIDMLHG